MSAPTPGTLPSLEELTPGNDGSVVVLIAYVFLVFTMLAMIIRIATTWTKKRGFAQDDAFLILAAVSVSTSTIRLSLYTDTNLDLLLRSLL